MVKYHEDEFGELVDEYTKVINNIKYQAGIAEEVANGNLTVFKPEACSSLMASSTIDAFSSSAPISRMVS